MYVPKTGIYKITSPTGKIYIGQSTNIERRFVCYKQSGCRFQVRLQNSFKKHGTDKHIFEIVELCAESELNDRERFYQDLYNVTGRKGLNCRLTTTESRSGKLSEEMKARIKEAKKNINWNNVIAANKKVGEKKKEKSKQLIEFAIEQLQKENKPLKKAVIARIAGISRSTVYKLF